MNLSDALQACADQIDLTAAVEVVSCDRNDLIPRRPEDRIAGLLGPQWVASVEDEVRTGRYRPEPSETVFVPKTRFSTRAASVMSLKDRVVFEALTSACRNQVERVLLDPDRVFWPRGTVSGQRWRDFEDAPCGSDVMHIVIGDVAGFYESIHHDELRRLILGTTGSPALADAIAGVLSALMSGRTRGLPQGVAASDVLATLYLSPVDEAMMADGLDFFRHGDDMRVSARSYADALRSAHRLEGAIRRQGLLSNSAKLQVKKIQTYRSDLRDIDEQMESLRRSWKDSAEATLDSASEEALLDDLAAAGVDVGEIGWRWYHGVLDYQELVETIRENLSADAVTAARNLVEQAFIARPGSGFQGEHLTTERFKNRFIFGLTTLQAGNDTSALRFCESVLLEHPDMTEVVSSYLKASVTLGRAAEVSRILRSVLSSLDVYILDWQRAWLYRVIFEMKSRSACEEFSPLALDDIENIEVSWIARVEAAKVLVIAESLNIDALRRMLRLCPVAFKADLVVATYFAALYKPGFREFLQVFRSDRVLSALVDLLSASSAN